MLFYKTNRLSIFLVPTSKHLIEALSNVPRIDNQVSFSIFTLREENLIN